LLNEPNDSEKDLFILMNEFEQESHKCAPLKCTTPCHDYLKVLSELETYCLKSNTILVSLLEISF